MIAPDTKVALKTQIDRHLEQQRQERFRVLVATVEKEQEERRKVLEEAVKNLPALINELKQNSGSIELVKICALAMQVDPRTKTLEEVHEHQKRALQEYLDPDDPCVNTDQVGKNLHELLKDCGEIGLVLDFSKDQEGNPLLMISLPKLKL